MRFACRAASSLLFWLCVGGLALAALPTRAAEPASAGRLLPLEEGLAVVNAAWLHREGARDQPDCSHLVHTVYQLAGLPYAYASSFDIYMGIESFAQVETPQPGDVIVWPGHVGIVVDARERSFYSSLASGLGTDSYDSRYWRGRGPARFYRYLLTAPGNTSQQEEVAAARRGSTGLPSVAGPAAPPTFEIPSSISIVTSGSQPSREAIAEAISELSNATANVLRRTDLGQRARSVILFDQFHIERVKIKGERGWAEVRVNFRVSLAGKETKQKRRREKRRWELRRKGTDWFVFSPRERVYIPSRVALPVLADQLALLTRNTVAAADSETLVRQQAQLARLLLALLETK